MADKSNKMDIVRLFDDCIKESICCTEPVAIGLSVSTAFNAVNGILPNWLDSNFKDYRDPDATKKIKRTYTTDKIKRVTVELDRDTYKNSIQVKIPYTDGLNGAKIAAALGLFCNPNNRLELYRDLTNEKVLKAADLINDGRIEIIPNLYWNEICIKSEVLLDESSRDIRGTSHTIGEHSNIVYIAIDNNVLLKKTPDDNSSNFDKLKDLKLIDLIHIVEHLPIKSKNRIKKAIEINNNAFYDAKRIFNEHKEDDVCGVMSEFINKGYPADDVITCAKRRVAIAVAGRMAGLDIKVMTCAGSGNVGLTATLPLIMIAERFGTFNGRFDNMTDTDDRLIRSVGLSYLVVNYTNIWTGYLSALCGCAVKAGIGATAGITYYLLDDGLDDIEKAEIIGVAINIMASTVIGLICDGAKSGCALKAAMVTDSAISSAFLALNGIAQYHEGIADKDPIITLKNIGTISKGMIETDKIIIGILERLEACKRGK